MENQKHLAPLTPDRINQLLTRREKLLTKRDALYDNKRVDRIEAILAQVPAGQNNRIDLALGRPCAQLEPRVDYGVQQAPDDYRIANRPNNPNWHGVAAWFDEAAHVDRGALFAAAHSPELAADVAEVREGWSVNQAIATEQAAPVAQRRVDDFLEWVKDQTADFAAHMAQYGAEMHDTPKDWRDLRGDLDI